MQKPTVARNFSYGKTALRGIDCIVVYPKQENDLWFDQFFENEDLDLLRSMVKDADSFKIEIIPESRIVLSFFHNGETEKTIRVSDSEKTPRTLEEIEAQRELFSRDHKTTEEFDSIFAGTDFDDPEDVRERAEEWFATMPPAFIGTNQELQSKINEWNALKFFAFDFYSHHPIGEIDVTDFNRKNGIGYVECSILTDKPISIELKGNSKVRFERMLAACDGFSFEGDSSRKVDSCLNITVSVS